MVICYSFVPEAAIRILKKKGDDVRIDWGHFYLAAEKKNSTSAIGDGRELRKSFLDNKLGASTTNGYDKLALVRSLGETQKLMVIC